MPKVSYFLVVLQSPLNYAIDLLNSPGYSWNEFIVSPGWFLFAGPGDNAIVAGKKVHGGMIINNETLRVYKIIKYIKNIYKKSLNYIF